MNNVNINCDFEQSILNKDLYVCKRCGTVLHRDNLELSAICPVLLDKLASDPSYPQIKLSKIELVDPSTHTIQKKIVPEKSEIPENDWWNNSISLSYIEQAKIEPRNMPISPVLPPHYSEQQNRKQCSQEQINDRMNICQSCEFFQNNTCLQCGCALSRDKVYMNKLLWADQSCPIGKWGPVNT